MPETEAENNGRPRRVRQQCPDTRYGIQPEYRGCQRRDLGAPRGAKEADTTKRNLRFATAKTATLAEAADIARAGARQLVAANARVRDAVAKAGAAGFIVQEDFSVIESTGRSAESLSGADDHAEAIQPRSLTWLLLISSWLPQKYGESEGDVCRGEPRSDITYQGVVVGV